MSDDEHLVRMAQMDAEQRKLDALEEARARERRHQMVMANPRARAALAAIEAETRLRLVRDKRKRA